MSADIMPPQVDLLLCYYLQTLCANSTTYLAGSWTRHSFYSLLISTCTYACGKIEAGKIDFIIYNRLTDVAAMYRNLVDCACKDISFFSIKRKITPSTFTKTTIMCRGSSFPFP